MKNIIVVCVYNRIENIQLWISCWKQCIPGAELRIIHNYYGDEAELLKFKTLCDENQIKYIPRNGSGFDIGAFQDVCKERLEGFDNDWNKLLWITDDTIPMRKDFFVPFFEGLDKTGVGLTCMEISKEVVPHVRTTGFCITKEVSTKLKFPADPITTKDQCYQFEHRGGSKTLTRQIIAMGLRSEGVSLLHTSPLWDIGLKRSLRMNRMFEHRKIFSGAVTVEHKTDKVVFICPIYNMYPQIISSLICQTHKNWELILIHNGPCDDELPEIVKNANDKRITFIINPVQTGNYGHPLRQWALNEIKEKRLAVDADYVVVTNADNYYMPSFIDFSLKGFDKYPQAVAIYSASMVHNYLAWATQPCRFERGHIDCGGVMLKKDVAADVGWNDTESHSSDWFFFNDIATKYGKQNFLPVKGTLFVHNILIFIILSSFIWT